jgi:hypothetical protein
MRVELRTGSRRPASTRPRKRGVLEIDQHTAARKSTLPEYICRWTKLTPAEGYGVTSRVFEFDDGAMRLERFPYLPKRGETYGDYGVPVSLSLLLRIIAEGAACFLLMFCLNLFAVSDNLKRANERFRCRLAAADPELYPALTSVNASAVSANATVRVESLLGFPPATCGWQGLAIRHFNATALATAYQPSGAVFQRIFLLRTSLGGCQEYRACNASLLRGCDQAILPLGPWHRLSTHLLIDTPAARYCVAARADEPSPILSLTFALVSLLVLLAFLVRIRWLSQRMARLEDASRLTTADYALHIEGLDTEIPPDELRERLHKEIAGLPFDGVPRYFEGRIHDVEVRR